jgi:hypothetical protein
MQSEAFRHIIHSKSFSSNGQRRDFSTGKCGCANEVVRIGH